MFKVLITGLVTTGSLIITGCSAPPLEPPHTQQEIDLQYSYRLDADDKLNIRVFEEKALTNEYEVDSNGTISFPLIGNINVKNKTILETEALITKALADGYIVDPKVSVEVITYRPFYIMGEVEKPGGYNYLNNISVSKAVALAGGYTYRANKKYALIKRANDQDTEYKVTTGTAVYPGDVVTITERYF